MSQAAEALRRAESYGYPLHPGIESMLLTQEHNLWLLACLAFDVWYDNQIMREALEIVDSEQDGSLGQIAAYDALCKVSRE